MVKTQLERHFGPARNYAKMWFWLGNRRCRVRESFGILGGEAYLQYEDGTWTPGRVKISKLVPCTDDPK